MADGLPPPQPLAFCSKPFYQGRFLLEDFAVIQFCSSRPDFCMLGCFCAFRCFSYSGSVGGSLKADLHHSHSPFFLCRILEVARCSQLTDVGFTTLARVSAASQKGKLCFLCAPLSEHSLVWCGGEAVCVQCGAVQSHNLRANEGRRWVHHHYQTLVVVQG